MDRSFDSYSSVEYGGVNRSLLQYLESLPEYPSHERHNTSGNGCRRRDYVNGEASQSRQSTRLDENLTMQSHLPNFQLHIVNHHGTVNVYGHPVKQPHAHHDDAQGQQQGQGAVKSRGTNYHPSETLSSELSNRDASGGRTLRPMQADAGQIINAEFPAQAKENSSRCLKSTRILRAITVILLVISLETVQSRRIGAEYGAVIAAERVIQPGVASGHLQESLLRIQDQIMLNHAGSIVNAADD
ncbi:hypothetical protein CC78DRAFT_576506 [Lojkania enalia]|uniref:Uncharacterized protein n=1 Tax=Lojkania enalia TaxID=147567 RepID=A0A9P4KH03_9PLEO|nr:hypothetical protein CC78DRAFT_576506 [Didymosphaeria enalia]